MDAQVSRLQSASIPAHAVRESHRDFKEFREAFERRWAMERTNGLAFRGLLISTLRSSEMRLGKCSKLEMTSSRTSGIARVNSYKAHQYAITYLDHCPVWG